MTRELTDEETEAATCVVCGSRPCTLFTSANNSPFIGFCEDHSPDEIGRAHV